MPTSRQLLTVPSPKGGNATTGLGVFSPGSADYSAMRAMYPGSPAYDGTYDDEHVVVSYDTLNASPINDGGHTFGLVNLNFAESPDLATVTVGGGGLPGTPYSPTPASPGPGLNPHNIPTIDPSLIRQGGGGYGVGDGLVSPSTTSRNVSRQRIGNLIFGRSTPR